MDPTRKNLLSFGFVREYCDENNIDLLPNDIVSLFALWLTFSDRFDENLLNKLIKLKTKKNDKYGEYQQIQLKEHNLVYQLQFVRMLLKMGINKHGHLKFVDI